MPGLRYLLLIVPIALGPACATLPVEEAPHPAGANRSEDLMWALDQGSADVPMTDAVAHGLGAGLKGLGDDLRKERGRLKSIKTTRMDTKPTGEAIDLAVTYDKSVFPLFVGTTWDSGHHLSGFWFEEATGHLTFEELAARIQLLPGDWSATASAVDHPDVAFRYRSDVAQPIGGLMQTLILARACDAEAKGELRDDQRLELTAAMQVNRSYPMGDFGPGLNPSAHDMLRVMMTWGDSTAAELLGDTVGWKSIIELARPLGLAHPPAPLSARALAALQCSAGPLAAQPPEKRVSWLASLSADQLVEAGQAAATDAYSNGVLEMDKRCSHDQPPNLPEQIAGVVAWPVQTGELAEVYLRAEAGKMGGEAASSCFMKFMLDAGNGVQTNDHIHRSGARIANEGDLRAMASFSETDAGRIAVAISVAHIPEGKGDEASAEMVNLAKSLTTNVWRKATETTPGLAWAP